MRRSEDWEFALDSIGRKNLAAMAIGAGTLLMVPLARRRSEVSWAAAAAGGILVYGGLAGLLQNRGTARTGGAASTNTEDLEDSIYIEAEAERITSLWRDPNALTDILEPFAEVTRTAPDRLRWRIPLPGEGIEGEVVKVEERPGELVHWRTADDSLVRIDEWLRVSPARGREEGVDVALAYRVDYSRVPAGANLRALTDYLKAAPEMVVRKILHNLKRLAEQDDRSDARGVTALRAV